MSDNYFSTAPGKWRCDCGNGSCAECEIRILGIGDEQERQVAQPESTPHPRSAIEQVDKSLSVLDRKARQAKRKKKAKETVASWTGYVEVSPGNHVREDCVEEHYAALAALRGTTAVGAQQEPATTHPDGPKNIRVKRRKPSNDAAPEDTTLDLEKTVIPRAVMSDIGFEQARCPKCLRSWPQDQIDTAFGFRKINGKDRRQSYCRECRGVKK